jgi:hypothetical protein
VKKVYLNTDVMIGGERLAAREGKAPRYGPQIAHDLKDEVADDLIARGDAVEVKDAAPRKDAGPRRVRKAVNEPATRALADAKDRSEPKADSE